jgi:ubiquinone/menaquinone biosynthesis C-methylase UbiE
VAEQIADALRVELGSRPQPGREGVPEVTPAVAEGWHCLEVGAGGGSIATWLCDRVGAAGHVVATDIDPRFLDAVGSPNLEVRRHDIASDPLPEAAFDLVHTRLVLVHLPEREAALRRIVRALKPG